MTARRVVAGMSTDLADFILDRLRQWNVTHIFGYPGDGINGLISALGRADAEKAVVAMLPKLSTDSRGQILGLASRWGFKGLDAHVAQLARDLLAAAADPAGDDASRIDAARQLIDLRKGDAQAARDLIALVTARTPPGVANGLIAAVAAAHAVGAKAR